MNQNKKEFSAAQVNELRGIVSQEGYIKKEKYQELRFKFNFSELIFKRELINNKIPFENTDLKNFLTILDVKEVGGLFSLEDFNSLGPWRKSLFRNSKVVFFFTCTECKKEGKSRCDKIAQRKYFQFDPLCSKCIIKKVTNTQEWREVNSQAQLIAQNKQEQLQKNREAQIERFKNPENIKKLSVASKKNWQNPEYRFKLEKLAQDKWKDPEYAKKVIENSKSSQYVGFYNGVYYNSSYELAYLIKLEDEGEFSKIERSLVGIKYKKKNGKHGYYFPDFILDNKFLIEVKGYGPWVDLENLGLKNKAGKKWCKDNNLRFRLVELKDFGYHYLRRAMKWHKENEVKKENNNSIQR